LATSNYTPDYRSAIKWYCELVISGEIVACKKYIWACMRFLSDCKKEDAGEFLWKFDNERAHRYMTWMRLFKHSKGAIAGELKEPVDYEIFVYGNIYGWVHKKTELRRFRRSYEQVARKNAKSQNKAIQALYEISVFGESRAEAYVAATKKEQTRFVWGEAEWLINHCGFSKNDPFSNYFTCKYDKEFLQVVIKHKKSGSIFSRLSQDDRKKGDGSNPHFVVLDEYHLHDTTEYYDMATSGQKTRAQPLLSIITTAGFDLANPCYRVEYDYVKKILDPDCPVENDRYFVAICEIDRNETTEAIEVNGKKIAPGEPVDDIGSDGAIIKSNPILINSETGMESIKIEVEEALDKPEKMRDVLTKTFNFWVNMRELGYMDMAKWAICGVSDCEELPDVTGYKFVPFLGFDMSATTDLTSVGAVFNIDGDTAYIKSHSFMPENFVRTAEIRDNVPYSLWISQGWITATPGNEVDYHMILDWVKALFKKNMWGKGEACFDRMLATWLMQQLDDMGFTPVDIPQSYTGLSLATKQLRAKVYNKKIIHENNPVLNWAMGNAVIRCGPSENIMLDKSAARFRIDPVAAVVNAMTRSIANEKKVSGGRVFIV
jgi:phage terminase large subunit-like protein